MNITTEVSCISGKALTVFLITELVSTIGCSDTKCLSPELRTSVLGTVLLSYRQLHLVIQPLVRWDYKKQLYWTSHKTLYILSLWQPMSNLADRRTCTKWMILFRLIPLNALHRPTFLAYCRHSRSVSLKTKKYKMQAWLLDKISDYNSRECKVLSLWKIKLVGSSPAQSSATRHWKFCFSLYPVTLYIHIPCHETLKCPPISGCGIWLTDVNQHPRQGWNALTQLGLLAFYLCHWPEKTSPGLPTRSSGLTGDTWSRYESQPKPGQHRCHPAAWHRQPTDS